MTLPADAPNAITRAQWADFVTGSDGQPLQKQIQDLEQIQNFTLTTLPAQVATAQATADAAAITASVAASKLNAGSFITVNNDAASLPQSRRIAAGAGISITDGGAANPITVASSDIIAILPNDVTDVTAIFVDATGLLAALLANSTYMVDGLLTYQSTSAARGLGLGFTLPAGASISGGYFHNQTALANFSAYNIAAGAVSADSTATPVANTNTPIIGRWIIKTAGTAGNAQLQFRTSNVAATATLKQFLSSLIFRKIG